MHASRTCALADSKVLLAIEEEAAIELEKNPEYGEIIKDIKDMRQHFNSGDRKAFGLLGRIWMDYKDTQKNAMACLMKATNKPPTKSARFLALKNEFVNVLKEIKAQFQKCA